MHIFSEDNGILKEITQQPFALETHVQRLVENNMKTIFEINFVASEFMVKGLKVDSLGYDEESNSFVIVEYKRDKHSSVFDQGVAYLALMLNNKADFIVKYNEKAIRPLKSFDEIDWSQPKVLLLSPFFTTHQIMALGFKELRAVELWEVKKYSNNTILFNQIESPYEHESIAKIGKTQDIKSVSKEIITYSEDSHLQKCDEGIRALYNELKDRILSISPTISVKVKKMYIAFATNRNFVYILFKPRRSEIELHLNLKKGELNDPKKIAEDITNKWHGSTDYAVIVNDMSDLGYVLSLIAQAYDKTNPK